MSVIQPLRHFDGTRDSPRPMTRVERVRDAARELRRDLLSRPKLRFYKSFELVRVPYPSKFGYLNAFAGVSPFLHLCNRLFVIQFDSATASRRCWPARRTGSISARRRSSPTSTPRPARCRR